MKRLFIALALFLSFFLGYFVRNYKIVSRDTKPQVACVAVNDINPKFAPSPLDILAADCVQRQ